MPISGSIIYWFLHYSIVAPAAVACWYRPSSSARLAVLCSTECCASAEQSTGPWISLESVSEKQISCCDCTVILISYTGHSWAIWKKEVGRVNPCKSYLLLTVVAQTVAEIIVRIDEGRRAVGCVEISKLLSSGSPARCWIVLFCCSKMTLGAQAISNVFPVEIKCRCALT